MCQVCTPHLRLWHGQRVSKRLSPAINLGQGLPRRSEMGRGVMASPAFLLSQIRVQKLEQAGMPTRRETRRQVVGAFIGVTEAVAYL